MSEKFKNAIMDDKKFYLNVLKNDPNNYQAILNLGAALKTFLKAGA